MAEVNPFSFGGYSALDLMRALDARMGADDAAERNAETNEMATRVFGKSLLDPRELAWALSVTEARVRELVDAGLPAVDVAGAQRFELQRVREWLASRPPLPLKAAAPSAKASPPTRDPVVVARTSLEALARGTGPEARRAQRALAALRGEPSAPAKPAPKPTAPAKPRDAAPTTKPAPAPRLERTAPIARKEAPVSQPKPTPKRATTTINGRRTVQTFHVPQDRAETLRDRFRAEHTAITALDSARRRVGICERNVRMYAERIEAASAEVEIASTMAEAHTKLAEQAAEIAQRRPSEATRKAATQALDVAAAHRKTAAEKREALEAAVDGLEAASRAKKDAEKELKRARSAAR